MEGAPEWRGDFVGRVIREVTANLGLFSPLCGMLSAAVNGGRSCDFTRRQIMQATEKIREHMPVFGSCGQKVGDVDHLEGEQIKLAKNSSPDGKHHFIPTSWVESV